MKRVTNSQLQASLRNPPRTDGLKRYYVTFDEQHTHPVTGESLHNRYVQVLAHDHAEAVHIITERLGDQWEKTHLSFDEVIKITRGLRHLDLAEFPHHE